MTSEGPCPSSSAGSPGALQPDQSRIPELDGLRGIAVVMVVLYHQEHAWLPGGGKMGVGLFFVLSGFIITSLLVRERARRGHIDLAAFYLRRARRLLPALAGFCGVWWIWALVDAPELAGDCEVECLHASILRAVTFTSNFSRLFDWDAFRPFRHLWSLAVEEQFYLLWPLLLLLVFKLERRGPWLPLGLASGVAVARFGLWAAGTDYKILYDTLQWDGLLLGCALGLSPQLQLPRWTLAPALLVFGALSFTEKKLLPGMATLDFVAQATSCAVLLHHALRWRWLTNPCLVHLGLISYSLYLWHYPFTKMWPAWVALPMSLITAELSYYCVERSFRRESREVSSRWARSSLSIWESSSTTSPAMVRAPSSEK